MNSHWMGAWRPFNQATRIALVAALMSLALGACTNKAAEPEQAPEPEQAAEVEEVDMTGVDPTKFAVVWTFKTVEKSLIEQNVATQTMQLRDLAKSGTAEAVYFDTKPTGDQALGYPSISFVVNAKSPDAAKAILDEMVFVKKGISEYSLHPVGDRWLEQSPATGANTNSGRRFVTVWTTSSGPGVKDKLNELAPRQSDAIQNLWRAGALENVYFDAVGVLRENNTQDFVLFVRANTEAAARKIVEALPFSKADLATYQIYQVGAPLEFR